MRRFTRLLFSLPHNGGAHSAPARERRGAKGPRERPSRGVGRSPMLVSAASTRTELTAWGAGKARRRKLAGRCGPGGIAEGPVV